MNGRWFCNKCSSWNEGDKTRCSFCSNSKPVAVNPVATAAAEEANGEAKLTQMLHNIIEKLTPIQKKKTYRFLEDNFI